MYTMFTMNELIRDLINQINNLKEKLDEQIENSGNPNPVLSGVQFPEFPYPNQIFCIINETPPEGGTLYRYDSNTKSWLNLVI